MVSQSPNGNGIPRARQPTHPPSKTQDAQNDNARDSAIDIAEEEDPYTLVIDSDEDGDEDPYTLPDPVEATAQQNATPTYENLPLNPGANLPTTGEHRFISRAIVTTTGIIVALTTWYNHTYTNLFLMHTNPKFSYAVGYRTERATSFSTYSNTGDSGFSDSRAYFKGQPPSSTQHAPYQREQGSSIDSGASPITTDVQSGYYKSLNPESRVPGIGIP